MPMWPPREHIESHRNAPHVPYLFQHRQTLFVERRVTVMLTMFHSEESQGEMVVLSLFGVETKMYSLQIQVLTFHTNQCYT
jgi:hypothetical protein